MARKKVTTAATPASPPPSSEAASTAPPTAPATSSPSLRLSDLISMPVLVLALIAALVSLAVEYIPAPIDPQPYEMDYALRTLEQQQAYETGVGRLPNSMVFGAAERILEGEALAAEVLIATPDGRGLIAGLGDGRVVSITRETLEMTDIGRTGEAKAACGTLAAEPDCGRPLGLAFVPANAYKRYLARLPTGRAELFAESRVLLVADAYKGLLLMDATGATTVVVDTIGARKLKFLNALAVTAGGDVYMTESSRRFSRNKVLLDAMELRRTGRLLYFDPRTGKSRVLAKELGFPNGLVLTDDDRALIVALTWQNKLVRYDIQTKTIEDFAYLPGQPDNVSLEPLGTPNGQRVLIVGLVDLIPSWRKYLMTSIKIRKLFSVALPQWVLMHFYGRRGAFVTVDPITGAVRNVYEDMDGIARLTAGVYAFGDHYYLTSWARSYLVRIPRAVFDQGTSV